MADGAFRLHGHVVSHVVPPSNPNNLTSHNLCHASETQIKKTEKINKRKDTNERRRNIARIEIQVLYIFGERNGQKKDQKRKEI